jgi:membrane protein
MAGGFSTRLRRLQAELHAFLEERFGFEEHARLPWWRKWALFWMLVVRSFVRNRCPVRASALAYTTLLALVPLLALGIGVSTNLLKKEGQKPVEALVDQIVGNVAPMLNLQVAGDSAEAAAAKRADAVQKIMSFINNIQSGKLGTTGVVGLVFVAIMLLSNIEATFNDIWGVTQGRNWVLRVVNYWAAITLGPMLFAVGLGSHLQVSQDFIAGLPLVGATLIKAVPYLLPCFGFAVFYKLMPNTKVRWGAALVGGVFGGVLWQLNTYFNVVYVASAVNYSKIYGSLAVLPLFLVGLYMSWLILLFGAQVGYAFQNREAYLQERQTESISQRGREFVALRIMTSLAQRFLTGAPPASISTLAGQLGVPSRLVSQVLGILHRAQLVREVNGEERAFVPARPLDQLTAQDILNAVRAIPGQEPATREEPQRELVRAEMERIRAAEQAVAGASTLQALAEKAGAPADLNGPAR